jgi:hypothetical protein
MEGFYNPHRLHSSLDDMCPETYELELVAVQEPAIR